VAQARSAQQLAETRADLAGELERKNRELEAFSYSVSHDLRAPLRSIAGFSTALLEDYAGKLDDIGRDYLGRVSAAAQRMGELIDDLLHLSRVGRAELQRRRVDVSALARHVAAELQSTAPERQARIRIADGVSADADQRLLQVVLENLLGNAWKFTAKCPDPAIELGVNEQGGVAVYFVRDNGAGFDMTYAEKLFAPFSASSLGGRISGDGNWPRYRLPHCRSARRPGLGRGRGGQRYNIFWTLPVPVPGGRV